ncbi:MAG: hypothetical protein WEC79_00985 [Thermomicrobiales bacterium]
MNVVALLELSDGSVAIVDDEDLSRVAVYEWRLQSSVASRYPVGSHWGCESACDTVFLHRLIANAGPEDMVFHRNHDTLDNRRENLVVMARLTAPACVHFDASESMFAD